MLCTCRTQGAFGNTDGFDSAIIIYLLHNFGKNIPVFLSLRIVLELPRQQDLFQPGPMMHEGIDPKGQKALGSSGKSRTAQQHEHQQGIQGWRTMP